MRAPIRLAASTSTLLVGALLPAGCGEEPATTTTGAQPPAQEISLGVFGGYPPSMLVVRIDVDGTGSVVARGPTSDIEIGPPKRGSFTLGEAELADLNAGLADVDIPSLDPGPELCADCLIYELRYGDERFETDRLSIPDELSEPIDQLERLAGQALPAQRTTPAR